MIGNRMLIRCPHCGSRAQIRNSHQETRTMRTITCQCTDVMCGFTFVASLEVIRAISPSAMPHDEVNLPSSAYALTLQAKGITSSYKKSVKKKYPPVPGAVQDAAANPPFTESGAASLQHQSAT